MGLEENSRPGRPRSFPPEVVVEVKALACELPATFGLPISRWSSADLAAQVRQSGLVASISRTTVWRWLHEDAIRPWQHRCWVFPRDPHFAEKAGRILDLYERVWLGHPLKDGEFVLSADEKTSIQARRRRHRTLPPQPGVAMKVEHEYTRCGAWAYLAALDVHATVAVNSNELYFSNQPLASKTDSLHYPALLNVSVIETPKRQRSWICTQHFKRPPELDWAQQLDALLHHIWNGSWNLSSESHEGASWYGRSKGVHPDLHPVQEWEKATEKDSRFGRSVPWKPVPLTAEELVECMFEESFSQLKGAVRSLEGPDKTDVSLTTRFMNFQLRNSYSVHPEG